MIWISNKVRRSIVRDADAHGPFETGGVLLGWRDGENRIVTDIIGPGPRAMHGRHAFIPDHQWQIAEIRSAFERTGGDLNYQGDWHTHPAGTALMSVADKLTLQRIGRRVPFALMLIAAGDTDIEWDFGCWMHRPSKWLRPPIADTQDVRFFDKPEHWPGR